MLASEKYAKKLIQLKNAGRLTPEHAEQLKTALRHINQLRALKDDLEKELEAADQKLKIANNGNIKVRNTAYLGVKIIIGNKQLTLKSKHDFTCFSRNSTGISCLPFS